MSVKNMKIYYANFKRSNKWLGIIEYKLGCIIMLYIAAIIKILSFASFDITTMVTIFCFLISPAIVLILISYKEENALFMLLFMFKYLFNRRIYVSDYSSKKFKGKIYKINIVNSKNR